MTNDEKVTKLLEILKDGLEWRNNLVANFRKPSSEVYEAMKGEKFLEILEVLQPSPEIPKQRPFTGPFTVYVNGQPVTPAS